MKKSIIILAIILGITANAKTGFIIKSRVLYKDIDYTYKEVVYQDGTVDTLAIEHRVIKLPKF